MWPLSRGQMLIPGQTWCCMNTDCRSPLLVPAGCVLGAVVEAGLLETSTGPRPVETEAGESCTEQQRSFAPEKLQVRFLCQKRETCQADQGSERMEFCLPRRPEGGKEGERPQGGDRSDSSPGNP